MRDDQGFDRYTGSPPLLFTSWEFIWLFLPAVIFLHRRLRKFSATAGVALLTSASILWYSAWDIRFLPIILGSCIFTWLAGKVVARTRSRLVLSGAILVNLTPLLYFKYVLFAFAAVGSRADIWIPNQFLPSILPLGISFYTFEQITYLVNVYQGTAAEPSLLRYGFFILFFPHLVAGPILDPRKFLPQIDAEPANRVDMFWRGTMYFAVGFVKKLLIADTLGVWVDPLYKSGVTHTADQAFVATFGYTLQLYYDFSGYSDMAMGLGMMFGFVLPVNFNCPYQATSFSDFWRRWHITLSQFLRNYIYIPLGGNHCSPQRRQFNLMATMIIGGLWHGAAWAFVIWGTLHGLLLCIQNLIGLDTWERWPLLLRRTIVLVTVAILWIPFRAESMALTWEILLAWFDWRNIVLGWPHLWVAVGIAVVSLAPSSHVITERLMGAPQMLRDWLWGFGGRAVWYGLVAVALTSCLVSSFYHSPPEAWFERHEMLAIERDWIINTRGDLRSALLRDAALAGDTPKWIIFGPSYASGLDLFRFEDQGVTKQSGSIGIGGQQFINWLRTYAGALDGPGVERVFMACSPLGFIPIGDKEDAAVYPGEGADILARIGVPMKPRLLGGLEPQEISPWTVAGDLFASRFRPSKYFQLQGFVSVFREALLSPRQIPTHLSHEEIAKVDDEAARMRASTETKPFIYPTTGLDRIYHWEKRGIIEGLRRGGPTEKALKAVAAQARARGIALVFYETPTLRGLEGYYPPGFFEAYQAEIRRIAQEENIPYVDLSNFLPKNGTAMRDCVHPTLPALAMVHRRLLKEFVK